VMRDGDGVFMLFLQQAPSKHLNRKHLNRS
jgi:hypothetical protein